MLTMNSDISIVICTYNKFKAFQKTIKAIQEFHWKNFELIIVNNNSTDETGKYCSSLADFFANSEVSLTYIFEPQMGLSKARNAALNGTLSKWLILLDDDCIPESQFLQAYRRLITKYPQCKLAGGPIRVRWSEEGKPSWLPSDFEWIYGAIENETSGDKTIRFLRKNETVNGGNFLVHRETLLSLKGFNENLGHVGEKEGGNEEHFIVQTLKKKFPDGLFWVPDAVVVHHFPLERLNLRYAEERSKTAGYDRAKSDLYQKRYIQIFLRVVWYIIKIPRTNSSICASYYRGYINFFIRK